MTVFATILIIIISNKDATNQDSWAVSRASRSSGSPFFYIAITSVCNSWNVRKRSWNVDGERWVERRDEFAIIVGKGGMPGEWQLKHF